MADTTTVVDTRGRVRSFAPEPASAAAARSFVLAQVAAAIDRDARARLELAVCELATNAILHARTPFTLSVGIDDETLRVEVVDANPEPPVRRDAPPSAVSGRGLTIVERITRRWGYDQRPDGKSVWFELPVSAPGAHLTAAG